MVVYGTLRRFRPVMLQLTRLGVAQELGHCTGTGTSHG